MRFSYFTIILSVILTLMHPCMAEAKASKESTKVKTPKVVQQKTAQKTAQKIVQKAVQKVVQRFTSAIYGSSQLVREINRIIDSGLSKDSIAVYVKSMKHGDSLYALNVNEPFVPASTMKILTAEAALLFLSPEYRFSTQLLTDAKTIKNGILQGNLYIVLSGDPSLTYYGLVDLMLTLRSQQIQAIAGNVYIDDTAYDRTFYGPGWDIKDKQYCFAAPIGASIINHNCISFKITPSKVSGRAAQVITSPKYFYPRFLNSVITKSQARGCSVRISNSSNSSIALDGCIPSGHYAWGVSHVITNIPEYNRSLFKGLMNQLSISVYGSVMFGQAPSTLSLIGSHSSKPLRLLVNDMLKKSDNVIAGALFKKIGQLYTRRAGSWESGSYAVSSILAKVAGVDVTGMRILDGSGLSSNNLATPAQMMQVLNFAYHHYDTSYEFISALPIAGIDGTLKHRMGNIVRRVRAKTGTISGVVSLAGYAVSADKEPLAFVIMINGSKGMGWNYKAIEDRIATALTRYKRE